jgi:hypothetical protein
MPQQDPSTSVFQDRIEGRWIDETSSDGWVILAETEDLSGLRRCPRWERDFDSMRHGVLEPETSVEVWTPFQDDERFSLRIDPCGYLTDKR